MVRNQLDSRGSLARGNSIGTDHTPEEIVDALGLHRSEIEWRKDFIGFSTDDARHLENLAPVVEANEAEFVNGFLQPLLETEKTKEIADRSPRDNAALQAIVSAYYKTLTGGEYGTEYFKHRTRIGMLHDKLEMPLHYFAGMFSNLTTTAIDMLVEDLQSTYRSELGPEEGQMASQQAKETAAALKSVVRILNLDMQVVNDTYLYSFTESLRGEIKATQQMRETVSASIDTARKSSTQVRGNATEMQSIIQEFKNTSSSVSIEVSDLSATIEEIAASSSAASNTSQEALEEVKKGKQRAAESVEAMEDIAATQAELGERVDELVSAIHKVNEIVDAINKIADQTNILALNASIEAARAGDAGSGFNVVASEVKSLAEQTQQEASEIETLLSGVTSDIDKVEDQIDRVETSVETGQTNILETDAALDTISQKVNDATTSMDEVATATDNQAASTEEVSSILDELNEQARDMLSEIESLENATEEQSKQITAIAQETENLSDESALKLTDVTSEGEWTGHLYPTDTTLAQSSNGNEPTTDGGRFVSRATTSTALDTTPLDGVDPDIYRKLSDGMPDSIISQMDAETLRSIAQGDTEESPFGGED